MKHTPGPWREEDGRYVYGASPCNHCIVDTMAAPMIESDEEAQANARLIAAAPDLLEACVCLHDALKDIINAADNGNPYNVTELQDEFLSICNKGWLAIQKAQGVSE